jgi:hypothetical protein
VPLKSQNTILEILPLSENIRYKISLLEKGVSMKKTNKTPSHNPFLKQKSIHFNLKKKILL